MSGGSSCSQTPSQAIPATRRVVLSDGVQLPPGDYSTTPGGTLFSTTPGGRHWLWGSECGRWKDKAEEGVRQLPIGRGDQAQGCGDWEEGVMAIRKAARDTTTELVTALPSGCVLQRPGCKLPH